MLHAKSSPEALGFARIVVYALCLAVVALNPIEAVGDFPSGWFEPAGLFRFLPGDLQALLLQGEVLHGLRWATMGLCVLLILGVRPFLPLALACAVGMLLFDGVIKGFGGFINHAQMGLLYAAWVLPFFPAADGFSVFGPPRAKRPAVLHAAPMALIGLCLATVYMLLGIRRFAHGGFEIFTGDAILNYLAVSSLNYSAYGFEYGLLPLTHPWLAIGAKAGYFAFTLAEISAPLTLFHARFRLLWLPVILSLHVGTLFLMNIFFWEQMILVLVFMTPLAHVFAPGRAVSAAARPPVIFYDGVCGLCNRFVNFVVRRDRGALFRFAPLQGDTAARISPAPGTDPSQAGSDPLRSVVLRDGKGVHVRSDAAIRVLSNLGGIWRLAELLRVFPRAWRDAGYDLIARNRYRWFGKHDACPMPDPAVRDRFLP